MPDNIYQFYLRNIVHHIKHLQDECLIPYGITNQQARIVDHIATKKENGNSVCQKDIENFMGLRSSSITSLLQGLERKGFILRNTSISDARTKELSLTPKGQALINEFHEIFHETEDRILHSMTEEEKKIFLQLLQLVNNNIGK